MDVELEDTEDHSQARDSSVPESVKDGRSGMIESSEWNELELVSAQTYSKLARVPSHTQRNRKNIYSQRRLDIVRHY